MALSLRLAALAARSSASHLGAGAVSVLRHVTEGSFQQQRFVSQPAAPSGPSKPAGVQLIENMMEGLQHKTEQELLELIQRGREAAMKDAEGDAAEGTEEEAEEEVEVVNPSTGEMFGPRGAVRGAEPTRFGDWEFKGKCIDF